MEMATAYQTHQMFPFHKYALQDKLVMEMEIVYQIQLLLLVLVDGNLMDKVDVFHLQMIQQVKLAHHHVVQKVNNLMAMEVVCHKQLIYHAQ